MTDDIVARLREASGKYDEYAWHSDIELEAADEIERLRKNNNDWKNNTLDLGGEINKLRAEIERLRAALQFYAEPNNWTEEWDKQFRAWVTAMDGGEIARAALGGRNDG